MAGMRLLHPCIVGSEEINSRIDTDSAAHINLRDGAAAVHISIGTVTTVEQVIDIDGNIHPFSRLPAQAAVQGGIGAPGYRDTTHCHW